MTSEAIEEMHQRISSEIDEAVRVAEQDPYPDPEDCLRGVYDGQ
jgi:TPP-dependent pyruvate/acetoin dehydrogenase alpha subunit